MAEEKILKDETLNDEELEEVVGGYYDTWHDYEAIKKLEKNGYGKFYSGKYSLEGIYNAFEKIKKQLGVNISARLDYFYDQQPGKNLNHYYLDGKEIPRDEFWAVINESFGANK